MFKIDQRSPAAFSNLVMAQGAKNVSRNIGGNIKQNNKIMRLSKEVKDTLKRNANDKIKLDT